MSSGFFKRARDQTLYEIEKEKKREMSKRRRIEQDKQEVMADVYKQMVVPRMNLEPSGLQARLRTGSYGGALRSEPNAIEKKFHDTSAVFTTITSGGTLLKDSFVEIVQGTGDQQRIGRQCFVKSLHISAIFKKTGSHQVLPPGSVYDTSSVVRLIVVLDKNNNGSSSYNLTDILNTSGSAPITTDFRELDNTNRFMVLRDDIFTLTSNVMYYYNGADIAAVTNEVKEPKEYNFNKLNLKIDYNNTAGVLSNITGNNLLMWALVDEDPVSIDTQKSVVECAWTARVRYVD